MVDQSAPTQVKKNINLLRLSGVLPVAAIFVPLSILVLVGWLNWRAVWEDAETEVRRAAHSAAEYGQRTLESYSECGLLTRFGVIIGVAKQPDRNYSLE